MNVVENIANLAPAAGFVLLVLLIMLNTVSLKRKGVKISSATAVKQGKIMLIYPVFVLMLLLFIVEIGSPIHGFSLLPKALSNCFIDSVIVALAGIVLIFLSVLLMKATLIHFGSSLRFGLNENNSGKLITTGIFARSRNPFFLSLLIYFAGTLLVFLNLFFLIFTVSAFTGIHFFILKEEKFMQKVYGEDYLEFKRKVNRYF